MRLKGTLLFKDVTPRPPISLPDPTDTEYKIIHELFLEAETQLNALAKDHTITIEDSWISDIDKIILIVSYKIPRGQGQNPEGE